MFVRIITGELKQVIHTVCPRIAHVDVVRVGMQLQSIVFTLNKRAMTARGCGVPYSLL